MILEYKEKQININKYNVWGCVYMNGPVIRKKDIFMEAQREKREKNIVEILKRICMLQLAK